MHGTRARQRGGALVPAERLADLDMPRESGVWWGPDACMVRYWVSAGRLMNWIAIARTDRETPESWSRLGRVEDAASGDGPLPAHGHAHGGTHRDRP